MTLIFVSCESHETAKKDLAFEQFKEDKLTTEDSLKRDSLNRQSEKANRPDTQVEIQDEWTIYRIETEKQITANEKQIKLIKGTPNVNAKLLAKITRLEKDNNDLRIQLATYRAEERQRWQEFKTKTNQNVSDVKSGLEEASASKTK